MEKSKKSQSGKSLFKNSISSIKFDLKNFQNVFVISVFIVFIFIMAATAISVWISKQAEPPTVEEYCANCRVLDVQQENINLLKSPSTSLPVLRIFGKDIQVCRQTCQNLRPIFNIQFECVPMALASKETIKEVYMAFDFLKKAGNLAENKLANQGNLNKKKEEYIILSSITQGKIKMADKEKEKAPVFPNKQINQNEQINQKRADQAAADLFLELDPRTVFFIGGHILTFDGIPNKENICEVVNDPACPPKNSSFIPKEKIFGLVENCYAWVSGAGGSPGSGSFIAGGSPGTSNNSNHWTQPASAPATSSHTHLPTTTFDPNFFSDSASDSSNWNAITYNADGSATIGSSSPTQSAVNTVTATTTGSGATYTTTGSWSGETFIMGGTSATGTTGANTVISTGGNNSDVNVNIGSGGITYTSSDVTVFFENGGEFNFEAPQVIISENAGAITAEDLNTLMNLQAISQDFGTGMSPEIALIASPADSAWIAEIISDPSQNNYWALTEGDGLETNSYVQANATIVGNTLTMGSEVFVALGDASWDSYFYSGSPHEITTSDGSNWTLTMMTRVTSDGSLEFLARDSITGEFVSYDPANPNANEIAYGYQLVVDSPAGTPGVSGTSGTSGVPGWPWVPPVVVPPINNAPVAQIGCDCLLCETTSSITLNNYSYDLEDGANLFCFWNIYRYPSMVEVPPSPYITCDDLSFPQLQVSSYQAKLTVVDWGWLSDITTCDFHILQAITAMFDYDPKKPRYGEEVQFIDQSVGTGNPSGGNYSITNWDWTFEDIEGNEATQYFITTNFSEKDPKITFTENGWKKATLIVTDQTNRSATYSENIYVGFPPPNWKEVHPGQK